MSIPKKVREKLRERSSGDPDIGLCERCCSRANNAHHRRNQSQQGQDVLSNLILLCGSGVTGCHGYVTANPKWATEHGFTIQGTEALPAEVPVRLLRGWVLLADDGSWELTQQGAMRLERDSLRQVVEAVRNLHRPADVCMDCFHPHPCTCLSSPGLFTNLCLEDMEDWPCRTRQLVDGMGA